ncbi:CHASE2 domain-containing protein [Spirulina subsalsa]|uniref:CHASE2 domain-containing protein n=1 Tax=Spirulina subsalsa TaxID=54311 RepID=UPI0002D94271|nr:CHASE2 domain-containing protein [Spirulina subsalsa]
MWHNLPQKLVKVLAPWRRVAIVTLSVTSGLLLFRYVGILQLLELWSYDQLLRLKPAEIQDNRVVIIGIEERDLQKLQRWPMSDEMLAKLVTLIREQKPRAIGLDLYRDLPVEPGHEKWVEVLQNTPELVVIRRVVGYHQGSSIAPPPSLKDVNRISSNDLPMDVDSKIRRAFLSVSDDQGQVVLGLGFLLAGKYLEAEEISPQMLDETTIGFGPARFSPFAQNDGGYVRAEDEGYQVFINYRGIQRSFNTVSLHDVLEGRIEPNLFEDRVVLIGSTARSLKDVFFTPYSSTFIETPEMMAGVEIHANIASMIISGVLEERPIIRPLPRGLEWGMLLIFSLVGTTWVCRWKSIENVEKLLIIPTFSNLTLASTGLVTSAYLLMILGIWLPFIPPLFGLYGATITHIIWTLIDNILISQKRLLDYAANLELKVEQRTLELKLKNEELEQTLQKLQTTQKQMIAQEKLAFLGSLTAGVAHEIRNPLNFVNNFSGTSLELAEELAEELEPQYEKIEEDSVENIQDILGLFKEGLQSISHHGQRIENIVKSMMMHAHDGKEKPEFVLFNELISDTLSLVQQGLSVKQNTVLIDFKTVYDPNIGEVQLIPKEISKAFLNIFSNACDTLRSRKLAEGEGFNPCLEVTTMNLGDRVQMTIRDNGEGIPPEIIDQIFNPFFTTKPTGEGTGLGLSLTYEAIAAIHQGDITVNSEVGVYTEFIVLLPKQGFNNPPLSEVIPDSLAVSS